MKKITSSFILPLLRGSSLLACGGGLPFVAQRQLLQAPELKSALEAGIKLVEPKSLHATDICVTVSEVGSASAPVMDKRLLPAALELLESKTNQRIKAIIPGEIGQEAITIDAAVKLRLPIMNSDLSGCRAVPRLTDLALVVQQQPFTMSPCVILLSDGQLQFIDQQASLAADETIIRSLVPEGEVVTMVGGLVTGKMIKKFMRYKSYTTARRVGKAAKKENGLLSQLPTEILLPPTPVVISKIEELSNSGFNQKRIILQRGEQRFELEVENEYMKVTDGVTVFSFPQLIMIFDPVLQRGLHSSELQIGQEVELVIADAFDFWKEQ